MFENNNLAIQLVIDASGSMNSIKDDTVGAINGYIEKVSEDNPNSIISIMTFNNAGSEKQLIKNKSVKTINPLTTREYSPQGMTALYDAIGKAIKNLEASDCKDKALVIVTDGQENDSREYSASNIKKILSDKQEKEEWLVIYLGANQDAFAEGSKFGSRSGTTMTYDPGKIGASVAFASAATGRYRNANSGSKLAAANFSAQERSDAI